VDIGSSYLPSDLLAAFLYAQFEETEETNQKRGQIYQRYFEGLKDLEESGLLRLPIIPENCVSNFHMFYILLPTEEKRDDLIDKLRSLGINSVFHYIPLHSSPMGQKLGYRYGKLRKTEDISSRLLRLPFYSSMSEDEQDWVIKNLRNVLKASRKHYAYESSI
jgi:dTDP-4-amino-4,6-dideoxygalactose transaminase